MQTYIVHGADRATGEITLKHLEAETANDAEKLAQRFGILVSGIELLQQPPANPVSKAALPTEPVQDAGAVQCAAEQTLWTGKPSQLTNCAIFVFAVLFCWLLFPIAIAVHRYLVTSSMNLTLTSERLRLEWGVLNKQLEEIELYRVRDSSVTQSLVERIAGIGTVELMTSDRSTKRVSLRSIPEPRMVRELIRTQTEIMRQRHRVRDVDIG